MSAFNEFEINITNGIKTMAAKACAEKEQKWEKRKENRGLQSNGLLLLASFLLVYDNVAAKSFGQPL